MVKDILFKGKKYSATVCYGSIVVIRDLSIPIARLFGAPSNDNVVFEAEVPSSLMTQKDFRGMIESAFRKFEAELKTREYTSSKLQELQEWDGVIE